MFRRVGGDVLGGGMSANSETSKQVVLITINSLQESYKNIVFSSSGGLVVMPDNHSVIFL